jgi:hypothetical protein
MLRALIPRKPRIRLSTTQKFARMALKVGLNDFKLDYEMKRSVAKVVWTVLII